LISVARGGDCKAAAEFQESRMQAKLLNKKRQNHPNRFGFMQSSMDDNIYLKG
jgi:hypothetical protein